MTRRKCCVENWSVLGRTWHRQLANARLGLVCATRVCWLFVFSQMQAELLLFFIRTILLTSRWCLCNNGWKVILYIISECWVAFQLSKIQTIKLCASLRDALLLSSLTSCRSFGKLLVEIPNLINFRLNFSFSWLSHIWWLMGFLSSVANR